MSKEMTDSSFLRHEGVLRKSGRYPWGSGENPEQRARSFKKHLEDLQKQGMTPTQIAEAFSGVDADGKEYKMNTTQLRALTSISNEQIKRADMAEAVKLQQTGMSNVAIGRQMGRNESSVRALLAASEKDDKDAIQATADVVRKQVDEKKFVDFGAGTANHLGVSNERLGTAIAVLKEEGYKVHYVKTEQMGTGKFTSLKVLTPPDYVYSDVLKNKDHIVPLLGESPDNGRSFTNLGMLPPLNVDLKRVGVRYAEDGGAAKDGVIEIRPGVKDLDMGNARYAQVRIGVAGTHYLKGMAVYNPDLPPGVDMMFNTNKSDKGNKLLAMKDQKGDPEDPNPFGSAVKQITKKNKDGSETVTSALNIVNEEGDWTKWSSKLSSQMMSKQSPVLAKKQLDESFALKKQEYDEIMALTNPVVKRTLLEKFADGADSSAVHLKAAGLPRTANHVILPINSLKDTEVYAPKYRDGEKVVLIRHPHGGTFEIPELTVNNKNREANSIIKQARDAIGINAKVAEQLSGADFDGDTVLVIPNPQSGPNRIRVSSPLKELKDFDPKKLYSLPDDAPKMSAKAKGQQMGDVSNLITDMTIKGAPFNEIARAVKHSMVVIDAEKHHLDYKQSAKDNGIAALKKQYQPKPGGKSGGASTLISQAKSEVRVPERVLRSAKDGGPIDKKTGKKVYVETGATYQKWDKALGQHVGPDIVKTTKVKKMDYYDDANKLSSNTAMEKVYATHANKLKALANDSRKEMVDTTPIPYSPSAKKAYPNEVASLNAKLNIALKNKPLERHAQLIAGGIVQAKRQANPDMDAAELKKIKSLAQKEGRARTGAKPQRIKLTPLEWDAIQAGAISTNMLEKILANSDLDVVKGLATPREKQVMTDSKLARAKVMLSNGHSQSEVAAALGVSVSTLDTSIHPPTTKSKD
jgi:DNA-binding CsgD family transcriptional regulator